MTLPSVAGADPEVARVYGAVHLTKGEVFDACQALADADRFLLRAGHPDVARALGDLFELLEDRLTRSTATAPAPQPGTPPRVGSPSSGSNSSESELTQ